jgi:hypothetical protein
MRRLRSLLAALFLFAGFAVQPSHAATDYTDMWWAAGGTEDGWGVNLAQNGNTIFATFFLYGPNRTPVWYSALLRRTLGETFVGSMVARSGGAWFGEPIWFAPPTGTAVGSVSFVAQTPWRATLAYTIDTVAVTKTIDRISLEALSVAGTYLGAISARRSGCSDNSPILDLVQFLVTQTGTPGTIRIDQLDTTSGALTCRMEGGAFQLGRILDLPSATYVCPAGLAATAHVSELRPTPTGFEARWFTDFGGGCTETGNMSGVTQTP